MAALATVPVIGQWVDGAGHPELDGTVTITPIQEYAGGGVIIVADPEPLELDNTGSISTTAVADPTVDPPVQLSVVEQIGDAPTVAYVVQPVPGQTLDLSKAPRGTDTTPVVLYVLAANLGQPNGVATLDADGFLTQVQRPPRRFPPVTLADAPTIEWDLSEGDTFRIVLGGNRALGVPTNAADRQRVVLEVVQPAVGGPFTLDLSGVCAFGSTLTSITWSTAADAEDEVTLMWDAARSKLRALGIAQGF